MLSNRSQLGNYGFADGIVQEPVWPKPLGNRNFFPFRIPMRPRSWTDARYEENREHLRPLAWYCFFGTSFLIASQALVCWRGPRPLLECLSVRGGYRRLTHCGPLSFAFFLSSSAFRSKKPICSAASARESCVPSRQQNSRPTRQRFLFEKSRQLDRPSFCDSASEDGAAKFHGASQEQTFPNLKSPNGQFAVMTDVF